MKGRRRQECQGAEGAQFESTICLSFPIMVTKKFSWLLTPLTIVPHVYSYEHANTEFILTLLFINCCTIFHMNNYKPTFVPLYSYLILAELKQFF